MGEIPINTTHLGFQIIIEVKHNSPTKLFSLPKNLNHFNKLAYFINLTAIMPLQSSFNASHQNHIGTTKNKKNF